MRQHFERTYAFIHSCITRRGAVLVHCAEGVSRSVTVVVAFLMRYRGWCLERAARWVGSRRCIAGPNRGFLEQLMVYDSDLRAAQVVVPTATSVTVGRAAVQHAPVVHPAAVMSVGRRVGLPLDADGVVFVLSSLRQEGAA